MKRHLTYILLLFSVTSGCTPEEATDAAPSSVAGEMSIVSDEVEGVDDMRSGKLGYVIEKTDGDSGLAPVDACWLSKPGFTTVYVEVEAASLTHPTHDCIANEPYAGTYAHILTKSVEILDGDDLGDMSSLILVTSRGKYTQHPSWLTDGFSGVAQVRKSRGKVIVDRWITTYDPLASQADDFSKRKLEESVPLPEDKGELIALIKDTRANFATRCTHPDDVSRTDAEYETFVYEPASKYGCSTPESGPK